MRSTRAVRVLLVSANRERLPAPVVPIGLLSVAAAAKTAHQVEVVDLCFEPRPLEALEQALDRFQPEVVGVGIRNLHTNAYDGTERLVEEYQAIAKTVRAHTRAPLVLGGAGFSLRPKFLLEALDADHGVVGEGEQAFPALLEQLEAGRRPSPLVHGAPQSVLDRFPRPARELCDPRYHAFDGTEPVQTKRGCAFSCSYCDYPDLEGRRVRCREPGLVADEVLALSKRGGVSHVFFVDSVFNSPRPHATEVCDQLIERGAPLPWAAYVTPAGLDDAFAAKMAKARCVGVELGTDSGSDAVLKRLKKPFGLAQVKRAHQALAAHGIPDCHTFVLGAEGETPDEVKQTLDFVDELRPSVAVFIVFMEDRESHDVGRAEHRLEILELLARQAPGRPGWVVPELELKFGSRVSALLSRGRLRGPAWIHLARLSRFSPTTPAAV